MTKLTRILSVIFILCLYGSAQENWQQQWLKILLNPPKSTPELRQKTFEEVWETVKTKHFDETFNGVNWDKVREIFAPKVANTENDEQLTVVLNQMLGEMRLSHNIVISPKDALQKNGTQSGDLGFNLKMIDSQAVVTKIEQNSSAYRAGLRQGFVINEVGGVSVKKIIDGDGKGSINSGLAKLLLGEMGSKAIVAYLDESGKTKKVTIERIKRKGELIKALGISPMYVSVESKRLDAKIGYVSFSGFFGVEERVITAVNSMLDASAIILDLRDNGGGSTAEANTIAGLFFEKLTMFSKIKTRKGFELSRNGVAFPAKNNFKGILVILINSESASASEDISAGFQELGRATIIGERSSGSLLEGKFKMLSNGSIQMFTEAASVTPKGVSTEGKGVVPDIEIKLMRQSLLSGGDPQLDAAVKFINEKLTKKQQ